MFNKIFRNKTQKNGETAMNEAREEKKVTDYDWIPFTERELTEEEAYMGNIDYMLDCELPEEDEEILVTYADGTVGMDIFLCDGFGCYLESGNEFITEAVAWRRMPKPYKGSEV